METNEKEISSMITLLETDYKANKSFVSLNKIGNKTDLEIMEQHPDVFYFASKSRVILVRWICTILRRMYETFGYHDINLADEGYDEIRNTLNTRILNRETLSSLFGQENPLSFSGFKVYEDKYYAVYNQYALKPLQPKKKRKTSKDELYIEFNGILCSRRENQVMKARAKGMTLDEVGDLLHVTRERARQVETIPKKKIRKWLEIKAPQLIEKICENGAVNEEKAVSVFGQENWKIIRYTIVSDASPEYHWKYIKSINLIIFDEHLSFEEETSKILNQAGETGTVESFIETMHQAGFPFISYTEACMYLQSKNFNTRGNSICEGKMTIGKAAVMIAAKYFPNGIHTTNDEELQKFSELLNNDYQMNTKPDRALQTRVQDVLTMCDRATYCAPSKLNIKQHTLNILMNFIQTQNQQDRIPYIALFAKYEKSLRRDGINNPYALHGVLKRYESSHPIICLKHYVCKKDADSLLSKQYFMDFALWLQNEKRPVSLEEIQKQFHGWNAATVKCAMTYFEEIVQWKPSVYINLRILTPSEEEKTWLAELLKQGTSNEYHYTSSYVMYQAVNNTHPEYLTKYQIESEKQLYYVLQYQFSSHYLFRRPHITSDIRRTTFSTEELVKMVVGKEVVLNKQDIADKLVQYYGNKNSSLSLALQKYLHNFIRVGTYIYVKKDCIHISDEQKTQITDFIRRHMTAGKILLPNQIEDFSNLPQIPCGWNPWVLCEMVDFLNLDFKKIDKRNTPSQNSMAIIMDSSLKLETKDEVFRWLIANDYDPERDKSEFQYAKATGIYHTNLTSEEVNRKLNAEI